MNFSISELLSWMEWLEYAAGNGSHYAAYRVGKEYLRGKIVKKDVAKALQYLIDAANAENQYAQYLLGKLYLAGSVTKRDIPTAEYWFSQSARQGNQYAQFFLDRMGSHTSASLMLSATRLEQYIKPQLGDKQISLLTPQDVQRMYHRLKKEGRVNEHPEKGTQLADNTVRGIHCTLHLALQDAVQAHIIARNPTEGATIPRQGSGKKQVLNDRELDAFLAIIEKNEIWHDFFYTELTTGLRRGEICGLMWRDFDGKASTLKVCRTLHSKKLGVFSLGDTKTGMGMRTIVLPQSTAELLRQRKKNSISQWIFPNPIKPELPTSPNSAYNHLKALLKQGKLPDIRFHDLRHPYVKLTTKIKSCS